MSAITSNTTECYSTFFGKKLVGIVHDDNGNPMMVFEDGRAFVRAKDMCGFWVAPADDVRRAVQRRRAEYERNAAALDAMLALASALPELVAA